MRKYGGACGFLNTGMLEALSKVKAPDDLNNPSQNLYPFCSKVEEYFKLDKKIVYKKIINGEFLISPLEITKTKQGTSCWQQGFKLVLEKQKEEDNRGEYNNTGYIIHHAADSSGYYCGWLYRKRTVGVRTNDLNNHLNRCSPGCFRESKYSLVKFRANKVS